MCRCWADGHQIHKQLRMVWCWEMPSWLSLVDTKDEAMLQCSTLAALKFCALWTDRCCQHSHDLACLSWGCVAKKSLDLVTWALHENHTIQSCVVDVSAEKVYVCFSTMFLATIDTYILEIQPKHTTFWVTATTNVIAIKLVSCFHGHTFWQCVHQGGTKLSCCGCMASADSSSK